MQSKDQPILRVVEGCAQQTSARAGRLAVSVGAGSSQVQLGLPGLAPPRSALICATVSALGSRGLSESLRELGVRRIVDLRIAPSFLRLGLRSRAFAELVEKLGVAYVHLVELSNRFVGQSWHEERYRQRVERHLEDHVELVERLREMVDDGPVMLIIAERSELELGLLLQALERASPGFELQRMA
jgi:hypothetical protein